MYGIETIKKLNEQTTTTITTTNSSSITKGTQESKETGVREEDNKLDLQDARQGPGDLNSQDTCGTSCCSNERR